MPYEIESNVPIPMIKCGRRLKYPFDQLKVGQSLKVDNREEFIDMRSSAYQYARRNKVEFTSSIRELRIWRIK